MQTFTADQSVELAVVERSGFVESRHLGSAVLTGPDGQVLRALGAVEAPVFVRSALKPLQAIASMRLGAVLTGTSAGLASASHVAELGHIHTVEQMLASVGLDESILGCPAVPTRNPEAATAEHEIGRDLSRLHFNCSGKHAGFVLGQLAVGQDPSAYLDPGSAVQREVVRVVEEYTGAPIAFTGVDGCGAPCHAVSLVQLARGVAQVASGRTEQDRTLTQALLAEPWTIQGHDQPNSVVIDKLGIIAKGGAEGVLVLATPSGHGVAVKCLDGSGRATTMIGLELLIAAGLVDEDAARAVIEQTSEHITGGSDSQGYAVTVGAVRPGAGLQG